MGRIIVSKLSGGKVVLALGKFMAKVSSVQDVWAIKRFQYRVVMSDV